MQAADPGVKTQGLLYARLEIALFPPSESHAGLCVCSEKSLFILSSGGLFFMVAFCLVGSFSQSRRESRNRFSVHKGHVRMSPHDQSTCPSQNKGAYNFQERNLTLEWKRLSLDLCNVRGQFKTPRAFTLSKLQRYLRKK